MVSSDGNEWLGSEIGGIRGVGNCRAILRGIDVNWRGLLTFVAGNTERRRGKDR